MNQYKTPSTGEANTGSNLGAGAQVFKQKAGLDLEHRTLVAGANITLNQSATEIQVVAAGGGTPVNKAYVRFASDNFQRYSGSGVSSSSIWSTAEAKIEGFKPLQNDIWTAPFIFPPDWDGNDPTVVIEGFLFADSVNTHVYIVGLKGVSNLENPDAAIASNGTINLSNTGGGTMVMLGADTFAPDSAVVGDFGILKIERTDAFSGDPIIHAVMIVFGLS